LETRCKLAVGAIILFEIVNFARAIARAKSLAENKLAKYENADEFVEIGTLFILV